MSFRDNLQYLRAQRNFTQERLAMLLGVSRQAISKWESGKAYPEMDKLLMICDLFGCTLDDLVLGDVRAPRLVPDATPEPSDGMGAAGLPEAERGICNGGLASDATSSNTAANWILVANLDTRKEYRRRGLATNLLNSLYKDIDKQGKGLYMAVSINNYNALKLYKELGFKENKKYKSDGNEYIIMIKGNADTNQFKNMNFS